MGSGIKNNKLRLSDIVILDSANIAGLVKVDMFDEVPKINAFNIWDKKNTRLVIQDMDKIRLSADSEKFYLDNCVVSNEYITWFIKIVSAFNNKKISIDKLSFYHSVRKDYPILVSYCELGMILAPRIEDE